jgi:hypothetical protein
VRVGIERLDVRYVVAQAVEPREHARIWNHVG